MTNEARVDLIAWARGANNKGTEESFAASTAVRASVHGDVVHSRPVAINFGDDTPSRGERSSSFTVPTTAFCAP